MAKATVTTQNFTDVKERGKFNRSRIPAGDYAAKIVSVEDYKKDDGILQYLFTIKLVKRPSSVFAYYCKLQENQLWKLRNILIAAGKSVPKSKQKVDPNVIVGKLIGVTIEDGDDYKDREQSELTGVFPVSELEDGGSDDDEVVDDSEEEDEDDEVEEEAEDEEEEEPEEEEEEEAEEGDEYDAMERLDLRKVLAKLDPSLKTSKSQSDDDLRDLIREKNAAAAKKKAAPAKAKAATKKKAADVSDDELEELDIDDL